MGGAAKPLAVGPSDGDRGQLLPLFALGVALAGLLAFGVARLGAQAVTAAKARTAADAAALAGAAAGEEQARWLAALNGARLVRYSGEDGIVEVQVELNGHAAGARARLVAPAGGSEQEPPGKVPTDGDRNGDRSPPDRSH